MAQEVIENVLPGLAVITPAVAAFVIPIANRLGGGRASAFLALLSSAATSYLTLKLLSLVIIHSCIVTYEFGGWPPPLGIFYEVDHASAVLGALTAVVMFLITLYSIGYMRDDGRVYLFYTLLMIVEAGMLGCYYTGDFFNLFVMIEVTSIASYILVTYYRRDRVAVEASLKYAIYGALATTIYFAATIFAYGSMGTLNMADMHAKMEGLATPLTGRGFGNVVVGAAVFTALMLYAFSFKAALFPNHFWLPDAHSSAPTPVSALLSGLVVNVGLYVIARFTHTVVGGSLPPLNEGMTYFLLISGSASALLGAFMMNVQRDVKKLIAYSTVMNLGYAAMGYGLPTVLGSASATYHLITHAVAKALLFMGVGVLIAAAGSRMIRDLEGLGRLNPFIGFVVGTALLTMAGVPPLSMFMSEYALITSFIKARAYWVLAVFLTAYVAGMTAYLRLFYTICVKPPRRKVFVGRERNAATYLVLALMAAACIAIGLLSPYLFSNYALPAGKSLMSCGAYVKAFLKFASALTR